MDLHEQTVSSLLSRPVSQGRLSPSRLVVVLGALTALGPLTIDMYLPALPTIATHFAASDATAQATLTGSLLGLAGGQIIIGPLADAWGRRRPLIGGMLLHVLASVACVAAPGIELLTVARTVQGIGASAGGVIALAVIRDLYTGVPAARLMSRLMLVTGLAPLLAPTVGSFVLRITSWNGLFVVLAVAGGLLASVAALAVPETNPVERRRRVRVRQTAHTYRTLLAHRQFVGLCLAVGFSMTVILAYVGASSFILQQQYGLSPSTFGLIFAVNALGLIGASQLNTLLLRRWSPARVLTGAQMGTAAAGAFLVVLTSARALGIWGLLVPLFLAVATAGLAQPNVPALALAQHGKHAGALLGASQFGVGALAPLVGIGGSITATAMAAVIFGAALAAVVVLLAVARPTRIPFDDETSGRRTVVV